MEGDMKTETGQRVAIFIDLENIFLRIKDVLAIKKNTNTYQGEGEDTEDIFEIFCAYIERVEEIAKKIGKEVIVRYGSTADPHLADRCRIFISRYGYEIACVAPGHNASDNAIARNAKGTECDAFIIGTQDGNEPFAGLVNTLQKVGKKILFVGYDAVAERTKESLAEWTTVRNDIEVQMLRRNFKMDDGAHKRDDQLSDERVMKLCALGLRKDPYAQPQQKDARYIHFMEILRAIVGLLCKDQNRAVGIENIFSRKDIRSRAESLRYKRIAGEKPSRTHIAMAVNALHLTGAIQPVEMLRLNWGSALVDRAARMETQKRKEAKMKRKNA